MTEEQLKEIQAAARQIYERERVSYYPLKDEIRMQLRMGVNVSPVARAIMRGILEAL